MPLLTEYHRVFEALDYNIVDIQSAYQAAQQYGRTCVDFKFAIKYYIVANGTKYHCIPINDNFLTILDYTRIINEIHS